MLRGLRLKGYKKSHLYDKLEFYDQMSCFSINLQYLYISRDPSLKKAFSPTTRSINRWKSKAEAARQFPRANKHVLDT